MAHNNKIKEYSSLFATKMNYILDLCQVSPLQLGRAKAIQNITQEKDSTVNNWLFNGKIPRENKKLLIADAIGVSVDYLFNNEIDVMSISKPTIYKEEQCYLIPYITENEILDLKNSDIFAIKTRVPIMFPGFESFVNKYGSNIYLTRLQNVIFEPHVQKNSEVIYSEQVIFEDFRLVIHFDKEHQKLVVKRVIVENNIFYLEFMNTKKLLVREILNKDEIYVSIILTYSS